jgi:hypothetical protein
MTDFKIKLTTAGKAALVDANNIGTDALTITTLELGSSFYKPTGNETGLAALIKPLATFGGTPADNAIIHLSIRDESTDVYNLGEIGLRTGTGVLLGIVSSEEGLITSKGANDILLVAADLAFTEGDISNITFGEASFMYQPGTPEKAGIFELATIDEVDAATPNKVIDAANFQSAITRRSSSDIDLDNANKLATSAAIYALAQLITANNSAIGSINALLQSDNADLDKLQEIVDYIETIKGTQDALEISNVAGLQAALNGKEGSHSHPYAADNHTHPNTNTWRGISDSTSSDSDAISASSKAVKSAYNKANHSHPYSSSSHSHSMANLGFEHGNVTLAAGASLSITTNKTVTTAICSMNHNVNINLSAPAITWSGKSVRITNTANLTAQIEWWSFGT